MTHQRDCLVAYFYPRPPRGGRLSPARGSRTPTNFYPRPPRGGRRWRAGKVWSRFNFYPRPPRGGRRLRRLRKGSELYFYPRPPRGGRPFQSLKVAVINYISIHALREEGDGRKPGHDQGCSPFLSTPSARRATRAESLNNNYFLFLSTPSARRATVPPCNDSRHSGISIHALREEGDFRSAMTVNLLSTFLSTPSARRATVMQFAVLPGAGISIHALREEGDPNR